MFKLNLIHLRLSRSHSAKRPPAFLSLHSLKMAEYNLEVHGEDSPPSQWFSDFMKQTSFSLVLVPDFFEEGLPLPAQAYLKVCSAVSEASLNDVKPSNPPAILGSPPKEAVLPSSGTTVQRRSVLHTEEIVRSFKILQVSLEYRCTFYCFILSLSQTDELWGLTRGIHPLDLYFYFILLRHLVKSS